MEPYAQLIHDYLDGNLESHLEEILFAEMGKRPELRQEFGLQMIIHRHPQTFHRKKSPPQFVKDNIFSALNIGTAGAAPPDIPPPAKYLPLITAILASSLITALATGFIFYKLHTTDRQAKADAPATVSREPDQTGAVDSRMPASIPRTGTRQTMDAPQPLSDNESPEQGRVSAMADERQDISAITHVAAVPEAHASVPALRRSPAMTDAGPAGASALPEELPFTVQALGAWGFANEGPDSPAFPEPGFSLGLLYRLSEGEMAGIGAGRESFFQSFTQTVAGSEQRIERIASIPVFGFVYRRQFPGLPFAGLRPFGQIFGGASSGGMLGKISGGLQYPVGDCEFVAGAELGLLRYSVQKTYFYSSSYGLVFGVQYSL